MEAASLKSAGQGGGLQIHIRFDIAALNLKAGNSGRILLLL